MTHRPGSQALAGLRVLDLTRVRAGPTCVRQLADWGADVIKIEVREADPSRSTQSDFSARHDPDFQNLHRNKRGMALDLKHPEGLRVLKKLVERADVVVENFRPDVKTRLGIDYAAANTLEVAGGRLTGALVGPVIDRAGKAAALVRFAAQAGVPLSQTVAVGDGANDLDMIATAGLGVAFNAKPVVRGAADTAVNVPYLDAVLYLLGISRADVENADAADGTPTPAPPVPGTAPRG